MAFEPTNVQNLCAEINEDFKPDIIVDLLRSRDQHALADLVEGMADRIVEQDHVIEQLKSKNPRT